MRLGVTGHQDIPAEAADYVREAIAATLASGPDNVIGVTSLASGADQLFASLVRERGGRLHVVLPFRDYEASLETADVERFRDLLAGAAQVETLDYPAPSDEAYLAAGRRVVDLSDSIVAIWDGRPAKGPGGTADVVAYARRRGKPVRVVWPPGVSR
jgi:hypothetical protein